MNVPRLSSGLACAAVAAAVVVLPLSMAQVASAVAASGGAAAEPAAASRPVEVAVRHSGTALTEGTDVDYTVTVRNTTAGSLKHLKVAQMLSAAVLPGAISDGGQNTGAQVLWDIDLDPGQSRDLHVAGHLGTRAQLAAARAQSIQVKQPNSDGAHDSADMLSSTACVQQSETQQLLGCSSDAGAVQVNPDLAKGHDAGSGGFGGTWLWAGVAGAALAALVTARTVLRRRGRSADVSGGTEE
ncbi:hypothetical protein OHV05_09195 [Kitasatospora sp. NBC_00070]|uniref:hypothetical protein n=1 Tax=Kitasatospora sp. NBC_00070 TaxID=2975962 RepID=UPI00324F035B